MTTDSWISLLSRSVNEGHSALILPSHATSSGFFAPLNCFGQNDAINNAVVEIARAEKKAAIAADQTFLVKPVNIPMPQALNSSRLLVVHNDAAAKAAAHLHLAVKNVCQVIANYHSLPRSSHHSGRLGLTGLPSLV